MGGVMQAYANRGGGSSVAAYSIGTTWIDVRFTDGKVYRYSYRSCGPAHCEQLKSLAIGGSGLNSYILRNVRLGYER
jgi:hypothetical protein